MSDRKPDPALEIALFLRRQRDWERRERELTAQWRSGLWRGVRNGLLLAAPFWVWFVWEMTK